MKFRKKVEKSFAHLERIPGPGRIGIRVPCAASGEFLFIVTSRNRRKLAKNSLAPQHPRKAPHQKAFRQPKPRIQVLDEALSFRRVGQDRIFATILSRDR